MLLLCWGGFSRQIHSFLNSSKKVSIVLVVLGLLSAGQLKAEPYVIDGQYLIRTNPPLGAASDDPKYDLKLIQLDSNNTQIPVPEISNSQGGAGFENMKPYNPEEVAATCDKLRLEVPDLALCEPNFVYFTDAIPNDSGYSLLWGIQKIACAQAWDSSTGSDQVIVAITDTGIDYRHPDLSGNIWQNSHEIPGNGIDDDRNGYIDDIYGVNTVAQTGDPLDDNGHGTHVAGTIGARGNNSLGVVGVNWQVKLMAAKFLTATGAGTSYSAIQAIDYAVNNGAKVINASWGGGGFSQAMYDSINRAQSQGVLFIAAAGNSGLNNDNYPQYPSNYNLANLIAVAATDKDDSLAFFSNFGVNSVHVAAPGVSIVSTIPGGGYASLSGTSMATPHVTGLAALIKAKNPTFDLSQIKARILDGDRLNALTNKTKSGTRINAARALGDSTPNNPTELQIKSVKGQNDSGTLRVNRPFTVTLNGAPGVKGYLKISLASSLLKNVGSCKLGEVETGGAGEAEYSGTLRLYGTARRLASSVRFAAGSSTYAVRISGQNETRASVVSKLELQKLRTSWDTSCRRLRRSLFN